MVKHLKYIFVYFLVSYFLLAGPGFNVVKYCCQACADEGIEAVATSTCFTVHKHTHNSTKPTEQHEDVACSDLKHQPENCHLLRLHTDIPSFKTMSQLDFHQSYVLDLFVPHSIALIDWNEFYVRNVVPPPELAVHKTGRAILSLNSVLLI